MTNDLSDIVIGDSVTIYYRGFVQRITKVTRVTSTLIVVDDGSRWLKASGLSVGGSYPECVIHRTKEVHRAILERERLVTLLSTVPIFKSEDVKHLDLCDLQNCVALMKDLRKRVLEGKMWVNSGKIG